MKKRLLSIVLCLSIAYALLPAMAAPAEAADGISYIDQDGSEKWEEATLITSGITVWSAGWYYVSDSVSLSSVTVSGNVHLILTDGCALTVTGGTNQAGIRVQSSKSLTIYGQSAGTGRLQAAGGTNGAGIGGASDGEGCGTVVINGGTVIAAGTGGAGIGGGAGKAGGTGSGFPGGIGGTVTINGGTVTASSSEGGAGIGGGAGGSAGNTGFANGGAGGAGGMLTINGGTASATGGGSNNSLSGSVGAGIGGGGGASAHLGSSHSSDSGEGGGGGDGGTVTINGGAITAQGGENGTDSLANGGAGIGGGGGGPSVALSGRGGNGGSGAAITISGGFVSATGGKNGAGIGGGGGGDSQRSGVVSGSGGTVTISGGTISAQGKGSGAGIGGGGQAASSSSTGGSGGTVIISGGSVNAVSSSVDYSPAQAIGHGAGGSGGTLKNSATGLDVYLAAVTLEDVDTKTAVTALSTAPGYAYGTKDLYTDNSGKLYLYLPADTKITAATTASAAYQAATGDVSATLWLVPQVISVSAPADGSYKAGDTLSFTVSLNTNVSVACGVHDVPHIILMVGGVARKADYQSGSGSSALLFQYTVQFGDKDDDGITVGSLVLSGGTIRREHEIDAALALKNIADTSRVLVHNAYHDGSGSGTADNPYIITSRAHLRELAQRVNMGTDFSGVYFKMANNIILTDPWTPIGTSTAQFKGVFDGNWKTVGNLWIGTSVSPTAASYNGLFGYVGAGGTVKNLTVEASNGVHAGEYSYNGLLAGYSEGGLMNCAAIGSVSGGENSFNGVLAGASSGVIANCWSMGQAQDGCGGGLAGLNSGSIANVWTAIAYDPSGGLVGYNDSSGSIAAGYYFCKASVPAIGQDDNSQAENVSAMSAAALQTDDFTARLNAYVYENPTVGDATALSGWTRSDSENEGWPRLAGFLRLPAPTGLAWDGAMPGKASWSAVSDAVGYSAQLYRNGAAQGDVVTGVTVTAYDFTSVIASAGSGSYTFRVTTVGSGGFYIDSEASAISAAYVYSSGSSGGGVPPASYTAAINGGGSGALTVTVDRASGTASAGLSGEQSALLSGGKALTITMPAIAGVTGSTLSLPASGLSSDSGGGSLTLVTSEGSVMLPSNMLTGDGTASGGTAQISIGTVNPAELPEAAAATVGGRPVVSLSLAIDGRQTDWSNPAAPVTVSVPYTPSAAEDPNAVVVWYIDGGGELHCVTSGRFDRETGTVTFRTTHFSLYAVGYNGVSFRDAAVGAWYYDAVTFLAARGITSGTSATTFSPDAVLTRGQFITLLLRAYDIKPDENPADNFSDAGDAYYTGYLSAAKRLGISNGVGGNMFAPDKAITRQDFFTLLYNALKAVDALPEGDSGKTLSGFADSSDIADYAREPIAYLVKAGAVSGSNGRLLPKFTASRAQMAQVLYTLMT